MKVEKLVTFGDAIIMAADIIESHWSYVYEKPEEITACVNYTYAVTLDGDKDYDSKTPSCVIGHIVHQFSDLSLIGPCTASDSSIPAAFREHGVTGKAQAFFDYLQKMQDRMVLPWGACFVKAIDHVGTLTLDDTESHYAF